MTTGCICCNTCWPRSSSVAVLLSHPVTYFLHSKEGESSPLCVSQPAHTLPRMSEKKRNGFVIVTGNKSRTSVTSAARSFGGERHQRLVSSRDVFVVISPASSSLHGAPYIETSPLCSVFGCLLQRNCIPEGLVEKDQFVTNWVLYPVLHHAPRFPIKSREQVQMEDST